MKKSVKYIMAFAMLFAVAMITALGVSAGYGKNNTVVQVPENVTAINVKNGVAVTWDRCDGADGFAVYRTENGKECKLARVKKSNCTIYVDKTAQSGKVYKYTVGAYKGKEQSEKSKPVTTVCLDAPQITSLSVAYGGIKIGWQKIDGALEYSVYRKSNGKTQLIATTEATVFKDAAVVQGKKYDYTVIAGCKGFKSSCEYKTSPVYVAAPKLKNTANADGYVKISWFSVNGADKYKVYRKSGGSSWQCITTVDGTCDCYNDKNVSNGGVYTYTVRAIRDGNYSGYDANGTVAKYVDVPRNITASNTDDTVRVNWSAVSGATEYSVYRKTNGGTWTLLGKSAATVYSDKEITDGEDYTYTVRAHGKNGGWSWFLPGTKTTALKSVSLSLCGRANGIALSWAETKVASEYFVYKKEGNSAWSCIRIVKSGESTYYLDKNVQKGKTYSYTVKQVKGNITGSYDNKGTSLVFYSAPEVEAKLSPKGILVTWSKMTVGNAYEIERMTKSNSKWVKIATVKGNNTLKYTDTKASYGELNYYRVRVVGYNALSNSVSIYGIDPNKPAVALTFDDGPYTPVTNRILDVLEKYNSRATFFVVGSRVNTYSDCIKREAAMNCEIANHTYNHKILTSASNDVIKSEINRTNDAVKKITGKSPVIVRAPGGSTNSRVKNAVGYPLVGWSVDTLDWKNSSGVVSNVKNNVRDGSIVLMHDLYSTTASATEEIVPWLVKNGYQLVTVSELMQLKGIYMEAGTVYSSGY